MSCRESRAGSALTTIARLTSGLSDVQTLSAFHGLRAEAPTVVPSPDAQQWQDFITREENAVRANDALSDARRRSLLGRLEMARQEAAPDGRTWYALRLIRERAQRNASNLNNRVERAASELGVNAADLRARMALMQEATPRTRRGATPDGYTDQLGINAAAADLPTDRASVMALHTIEREALRARADRALSGPQRIERRDIGSGLIAEAGYDPDGGRLELVFRGRDGAASDRVYAYRGVPQETWDQFQTGAGSATYNEHIRGRSEYQYPSREEADLDSAARQCGECGQFASSSHACPTRIAREAAAARTPRRARTTQTAAERVEEAIASRPPARPASHVGVPTTYQYLNQRTSNYADENRYDRYCAPRLTALRAAAQTQPVEFRMTASMNRRGTDESGSPRWRYNQVRAEMTVDRPVRGQYVVVAREARCDCDDYARNGHCPHIDEAVNQFRSRFIPANMSEAAQARNDETTVAYQSVAEAAHEEAVRRAAAEAEEAARVEAARAEEARARYVAEWQSASPEDSYENNFSAFEADLAAAAARKAAGESAIPYLTENATGGMCAPGSGRAFGVEIEFDIDPSVDQYTALRAIGRDMHAAGLTRSAAQSYYHAAAGRGYTEEHQGGWSYEQDCTVAGEIVSPIMYDTPETWENLAKVCEIVKRNGGVASVRTGSHVHVSTPNTTTETATGMLKIANQYEDVLYRVSANPETGTHRPMRWCAPNREVPAGGYASVAAARNSNNSHNLGLNMQSVNGAGSDHAEMRHWDGTLDAAVIQAQIKTSAAVIAAAQRGAGATIASGSSERTGTRKAAADALLDGSRRNLTQDERKADTTSVRQMADLLFARREDKAQFAALFSVTKWQSRLS